MHVANVNYKAESRKVPCMGEYQYSSMDCALPCWRVHIFIHYFYFTQCNLFLDLLSVLQVVNLL